MPDDWKQTEIWKALRSNRTATAAAVRTCLELALPHIEAVLAQGGTAPAEFTLHDAGHSFRVARRMAEVIPTRTFRRLSPYELAFLLLSAYLHDIGMTPARRKVRLHYQYVLTGDGRDQAPDREDLSAEEVASFQRWLDDQADNVKAPLGAGLPTAEALSLANHLTTHYCRFRHGDWSAEWIRENLGCKQLATYSGWVDDLVLLCNSHHFGHAELVRSTFDPHRVGTPAENLHLRYLACVLRIADVLDLDPERTPEVVLRHRSIAPGSLIFWWKDHELSISRDAEAMRYVVWARPSSARVQRAVEETVDGIEQELRLCRQIADQTHFDLCPLLQERLPHAWDLQATLHRDIAAKGGAYEYIDGSFRPNTRRVLQLLGGIELYRDPLAGVRELLQNAFDAVREQIAYQRLSQPDPGLPNLEAQIARLHHVKLELNIKGDEHWLICSDTGAGMSKRIIRDHLLVSGNSRRHDLAELDRRCERAGFRLGRTGQFGIGVLSYFMLADFVVIRTHRSQDAEDTEQNGWVFESEGVGSFGELKQDTFQPRGTEVRLRLRDSICDGTFCDRLISYLQKILALIPCKFHFQPPSGEPLAMDPGWVRCYEPFLRSALSSHEKATEPPVGLLPAAEREKREREQEYGIRVLAVARDRLRWETREGELPGGVGCYRIHLPFFELTGGTCLGFVDVSEDGSRFVFNRGEPEVLVPMLPELLSWRGIGVSFHSLFGNRLIELEFSSSSAARPAVSRDEILLTKVGLQALGWVREQAQTLVREYARANPASPFATLNAAIAGEHLPAGASVYWAFRHANRYSWEPIRLPCTTDLPLQCCARALEVRGPGARRYSLADVLPADRVFAVRGTQIRSAVPLWFDAPAPGAAPLSLAAFPPAWPEVVGYRDANVRLWNRNHPFFEGLDYAEFEPLGILRFPDPLKAPADWLRSRQRAVALLVHYFSIDHGSQMWDGLVDRDPAFTSRLWELARGHNPKDDSAVLLDPERLHRISPTGWTTLQDPADWDRILPDAGPGWTIEVEDE